MVLFFLLLRPVFRFPSELNLYALETWWEEISGKDEEGMTVNLDHPPHRRNGDSTSANPKTTLRVLNKRSNIYHIPDSVLPRHLRIPGRGESRFITRRCWYLLFAMPGPLGTKCGRAVIHHVKVERPTSAWCSTSSIVRRGNKGCVNKKRFSPSSFDIAWAVLFGVSSPLDEKKKDYGCIGWPWDERVVERWARYVVNDYPKTRTLYLRIGPWFFERINNATTAVMIVSFITITHDNVSFDNVLNSSPKPQLATSPTQRQTSS
ncbi:hypothetical protein CPC08DRAFT_730241 [Agrocybe pediades]|nr:hypothetical protein CPC08DRAFT_730241 [Agrocybe pediades]